MHFRITNNTFVECRIQNFYLQRDSYFGRDSNRHCATEGAWKKCYSQFEGHLITFNNELYKTTIIALAMTQFSWCILYTLIQTNK